MIRTHIEFGAKGRRIAAVLAWACCLAMPGIAAAQSSIQSTGFSLQINEKEMMLAHPGNQAMTNYATWDTGYQRILARNMPFVYLTNNEDSAGPITELRLTIGDERFNFGNTANMFHGLYTMPGRTNPNAALSSHVEDVGNELVVNFGSGLLPGESICFRINLDVDAGHPSIYPYPDYRTVMFDMNGVNIYDGNLVNFSDADNATATVKYGTLGSPPLEVGPLAFHDDSVSEPGSLFYNRIYRPYGVMEPADTFQVGASTEIPIPEPSSIVLGLVGCVGGALLAARARRRRAE
jgi:hypothetical protein